MPLEAVLFEELLLDRVCVFLQILNLLLKPLFFFFIPKHFGIPFPCVEFTNAFNLLGFVSASVLHLLDEPSDEDTCPVTATVSILHDNLRF